MSSDREGGIDFVQFKTEVNMVTREAGSAASSNYWSKTKHGRDVEVVEKGPNIILTCHDGTEVKVPISNVAWVRYR